MRLDCATGRSRNNASLTDSNYDRYHRLVGLVTHKLRRQEEERCENCVPHATLHNSSPSGRDLEQGCVQQGSFRGGKLAEQLSLSEFDKIREAWLAWHWWYGSTLVGVRSMASIPTCLPLTAAGDPPPVDQQVIFKILNTLWPRPR